MKAFQTFRPFAALAAALLLVPAASAAPVSVDEAKLLVSGYRAYMDGEVLGGTLGDGIAETQTLDWTFENGDTVTLAYAFQFEGGGWIVVSADTDLNPVPAFSATGKLGDGLTNEASPARFFLLSDLAGQYLSANPDVAAEVLPPAPKAAAAPGEDPDEANGYAGSADALDSTPAAVQNARWAKFRAAVPDPDRPPRPKAGLSSPADLRVPALLKTTWAQSGGGENYYTPSNCVSGCTQTAWGQVINYFQWPKTARGVYRNERGSIYGPDGSRVYVDVNGSQVAASSDTPYVLGKAIVPMYTRGGDGKGGAYDWKNMPLSSSYSNTETQRKAIGSLLVDVGCANGAEYKSSSTGAHGYPTAIMAIFGFSNIRGTAIASGTSQTAAQKAALTNSICCNADAGMPCPISGYSSSSGHATVADGYGFQDGEFYFHVNFGWGGSSDGFYMWENWGGYVTRYVYYNFYTEGSGEIVSGRTLTPDGRVFPNATVTLTLADGSKRTTTSNERGIWAFTKVPSSTTVSVTAAGGSDYTFPSRSVTTGLSSGTVGWSSANCGNVWGVDLYAAPVRAMVHGTVRNPEGAPIPGVRVVTGDGLHSDTTDDAGIYSFFVPVGWSGVVKLADGQGQIGCSPVSHSVSSISAGTAKRCDFTTALVIFVDCDATDGANDGTSWADAFTDLKTALAQGRRGAEVWVAEGVYVPGTKRGDYFEMVESVAVFGGFSGVETARSQRNWIAHRTVISGEIGDPSTKTDNCATLVFGAKGAALDGFVLTDAYRGPGENSSTFGWSNSNIEGVIWSQTSEGSPGDFNFLVEHCLIAGNQFRYTLFEGWGLYRSCVICDNVGRVNNTYSSIYISLGGSFVNCTFADNEASCFCNQGSYTPVNYGECYFENCYFKQELSQTSSSYGQYYYAYPSYVDASQLKGHHNLHRTADQLSITNSTMVSGASLQRADETLSGPPAAPCMPPSSSKAKDKGCVQGWAANATDFLGNPRVNGTIDIGAYEITAFSSPFVALGVRDVSYHTANAILSIVSLGGSATSGTAVLKYGTSANLSGAESVSASVGIGEKTFSLSGLLAGTTYYVQVTVTGSGTTSTEILSFTTKPMTAPDVAIGTVGEPTGSSVTVDWSMSSIGKGVTKATVYVDYSTSSTFASGVQSKTVKENATGAASGTVTLTGLFAGVTYYLRVRGVNDAPLTGYSATKTVTTVDAAAPDFSFTVAPSETVTRGVVTLSVTKFGTGASSGTATIEYATKADFSDAKTATAAVTRTGETAVTLTRLSAGTLYYVRVTLVNNQNKSLSRAAKTFTTADPGYYASGLLQAVLSGAYDKTTDIASHTSATLVPGTIMAYTASKGSYAWNGTTYSWADNRTFGYVGEMHVEAGTTYTFGKYLDDSALVKIDGRTLIDNGTYTAFPTADYTATATGWVPIEVRIGNGNGGSGAMANQFGVGFNTVGNKTKADFKEPTWSKLIDPGDKTLLRVKSIEALPSFVELNDDLVISGTTLTGSVHTDGIEDGCTITLYAGKTNAGETTEGWAQSKVIGTVPSEGYDLSFQWDEFCSAGDLTGWFVIARMTNASGSYEGWSVVREPSAGNVFYVAIQEGETGLTTVAARPRVAGFGEGAASATVCLEYSTDANFGTKQTTAAVTATKTNWLASVTISGLTPNTVYYVRTKGVKGSQTVYSRTAQLATKDYGTPVASLTVGTTTLNTIPLSWSVTSLGLGNMGAEVWLEYGTSAAYGQSLKLKSITGADNGSYTLADLPGETTYHFRLRVVATPSGKVGTSAAASGSTKPVGNPAVDATLGAVAQYTATFSYRLTALGEGAVSASLYYDVATSSDFSGAKSTLIVSGVTSVPKVGTATVTGLDSESTYYVRVRAVNHANKVGTSATLTVNTTAVGNPEVAVDMTSVLQRAATASISIATLGEAAKSGTVTLEYGTSTAYGKTATVSGAVEAGAVLTAALENLETETTYYVKVTVRNDAGKTATATTSFKTLEPNDPAFTYTVTPSYTAGSFALDVTKIGNGAASAAGYIRYGTSASALTLGTAQLPKIVEPGPMNGAITGLSAGNTYYYEIVVTNNLAGLTSKTGSFTTKSAATLAWGEGYYEPGLIMGYYKPSGNWGFDRGVNSLKNYGYRSSGAVVSFARGAISSYATRGQSFENPLDGTVYVNNNYTYWWSYEGQMWMEAGVVYYFASSFFDGQVVMVDGNTIVSESGGGAGTPSYGHVDAQSVSGWHDIKIVNCSEGNNGAGACGNPWQFGSPFTSVKYGAAWNTNNMATATSSNASQWHRLMDAGDRHLFRARGRQGEMAFLDQPATWTANSLKVPVRLDPLYDNLTLTVYASRSPDGWYFENRWEKKVVVGSTGTAAAKTLDALFTGIDATVDWYVSARLTDGDGYDQWTDPVKFTPQIVKQPPAGAVTVGTPTFTSNTATVSVTSFGDETASVEVVLEYAQDQAFTSPATKTGATVTKTGSQDFSLTGLQPGKTYYVRARLTGTALGLETVTEAVSFTTPAYTAPVIAAVDATAAANSATISVNVTSLGQGSTSADIEVYVSTGAFGATPSATRRITATGVQTFTITGLQAGTAYFVKVVVKGSNGLSATNTDASFVTGAVTPPSGTLTISGVTASSASAAVALASLGDAQGSVAVSVEYATDAAFSAKLTVNGTAATAAGSQVLALVGLSGETKYYARAVFAGTREGEPLVGYSETVEFTTLGAQPPAGTLEVSEIAFDGATVTLAVTSLGDDATSVAATLLLADNEAMTGATTVAEPTFAKTGSLTFALSDLAPGKTYYLRATLTGSPSGLSSVVTKSFATTAYGAPVLGTVTDEATFHSVTLAVPVTDLGAGSDSVELSVCVDVEYGCVGGVVKTATLSAPGTSTLSWDELQPGTKYYWYAKATGSNGLVAESRGDFTTPLYPLVLGEASATTGENGLSATMRVTLLNLASPPATVKLYLGTELLRTWSDVTEAGDFEHTATTEVNKKYTFKFVATAGGETVTASGSFQTVAAEDWFNVRWGEDGYATGTSWNVAGAVPKSGGSWTRPSGDESTFDGARLRLVPPEEGLSVLRFTPSKPVKASADVTVEGSTVVSVGSSDVEAPTGARGGLLFLADGPRGLTRDGWMPLQGIVPESGDTVAWKMEVALSGENAPAVRYTVNGTVLSDSEGRQWFGLPPDTTSLTAVGFAGGGSLGDFRGFYKAQLVGRFEKPNFGAASADGDALGFGVDPATGKATFAVSIDNASDDAVYGVYAAEAVTGPYVRVANPGVARDGTVRTFTITVSDGEDAQFVVILAAESEESLPAQFDDPAQFD